MSPKKSVVGQKIDDEVNTLLRQPLRHCSNPERGEYSRPKGASLYPELSSEKENMEINSSGDSPEKPACSVSPRMERKSNSSSSTDSMQDMARSPKGRSTKNLQSIEDSDIDLETDDFGNTYPHKQGQETPKIYPDITHKWDGFENDTNVRRRSNKPKRQSQKTQVFHATSSISSYSIYSSLYFYMFLLAVICAILVFCFWPRRDPGSSSMNVQLNATDLVKVLKPEFQGVPTLTFRIIHSALKKVLEAQPKAPAILLLLATNGSITITRKFAHRLVSLLPMSEYNLVISGKDYKAANTNSAKREIDDNILKTLKSEQLGSVLIDNLDQIPGNAAMILHKYCDHENAPFKKAVFVMTVNYNKPISDHIDTKVWDKAANDHLLSVWTDIGVDQVTPLLARLTVSVAIITV